MHRQDMILKMKSEGKTYSEIGLSLGISRQRVYQIATGRRLAKHPISESCVACGSKEGLHAHHISYWPPVTEIRCNICHKKAHIKSVKVECPNCGTFFTRLPSKSPRRCCSRKCGFALRTKMLSARTEKRCCKCAVIKTLSEFPANKGYVDGHDYRCSECNRLSTKGYYVAKQSLLFGTATHGCTRGNGPA